MDAIGEDSLRRSHAAKIPRAADAARKHVRVELGYVALLVSAFVLPEWIGYRAWVPALALATAFAMGHGLVSRRRPLLPAAMLAYLGVYAVAALHSDPDTFSVIEVGKFLAPPVFALAVAWAAQERQVRRAMIVLAVGAVAIQVPVAIGQAVDAVVELGREDAVSAVDYISGLTGELQSAALSQAGLLAAAVILSAAYLRAIAPRWGIPLGLALAALTVLSSTRAGYLFAAATLGAIAVALWISSRQLSRRGLMVRTAAVLAIVIAPAMALATGAIYPGANEALTSPSGVTTALDEGDEQLREEPVGSARQGGAAAAEEAAEEAAEDRNPTLLPGRGAQLTLALELSIQEGFDVALLGRGIGSTRFKDDSLLAHETVTFDRVTRPEQNTNGVWIPRTITETGYLGLLAFLGLIAYIVALWWRNREIVASPTWDAAVIVALPGIAALTLASAFYNTVLAIQPYATLFWATLGLAIALDSERSRSSSSTQSAGQQ
jgi:hypothetical protein